MSPGLRDLSDDSGQEVESVDFFEPREKLSWIVVRGFGSVENVRRAWAPLHSGQAHGGAEHVAGDVFESLTFARWDTNGIIDIETAPSPRQQELDTLVAQKVLFFQ